MFKVCLWDRVLHHTDSKYSKWTPPGWTQASVVTYPKFESYRYLDNLDVVNNGNFPFQFRNSGPISAFSQNLNSETMHFKMYFYKLFLISTYINWFLKLWGERVERDCTRNGSWHKWWPFLSWYMYSYFARKYETLKI
jgi:hypothetical protein